MQRQVAFELAIGAGYLGPRTAEKNVYAVISAKRKRLAHRLGVVLYPYFQNSNLEGVNPTVFANLFRQWFQQHRRNSSSAGG
jgi:hypothetical protein